MTRNELGGFLQEIRAKHGERLLDMARKLGKSSAFISAIETGRKQVPEKFAESVSRIYNLSQGEQDRLNRASDRSRETFTLQPETKLEKEMVGLMARKLNTLEKSELDEIFAVLSKKQGQSDHEPER